MSEDGPCVVVLSFVNSYVHLPFALKAEIRFLRSFRHRLLQPPPEVYNSRTRLAAVVAGAAAAAVAAPAAVAEVGQAAVVAGTVVHIGYYLVEAAVVSLCSRLPDWMDCLAGSIPGAPFPVHCNMAFGRTEGTWGIAYCPGDLYFGRNDAFAVRPSL